MSGIALAARRIARILKTHGVSPVPAPHLVADVSSWALGRGRWGRFLHDGGLDVAGASDGLYGVRDWRVQIVGSTPHPNDLFMSQVGRTLIETDGLATPSSRADLRS